MEITNSEVASPPMNLPITANDFGGTGDVPDFSYPRISNNCNSLTIYGRLGVHGHPAQIFRAQRQASLDAGPRIKSGPPRSLAV